MIYIGYDQHDHGESIETAFVCFMEIVGLKEKFKCYDNRMKCRDLFKPLINGLSRYNA